MSGSHDSDGSLSGTYRPEDAEGGVAAEMARLRCQVELSWSEEQRLLLGLGLTDGMAVVDLGAGPGYVTEKLLSLLPSSPLCAVEIRPDFQAEAERRLGQRGGDRLTLLHGSALHTGLPAERFDVAVARYLFQHVQDPIAAAKEAHRILRPGGRLVVIEVDAALWGLAEPFAYALQPIYAKAERLQTQRGGDRLIGRRLPRILQASGYEDVRLESFVYHSDTLGLEAFRPQLSANRLLPAMHAGIISPAEFGVVDTEVKRFMSDPSSFVLMLGFLAHGVRR